MYHDGTVADSHVSHGMLFVPFCFQQKQMGYGQKTC